MLWAGGRQREGGAHERADVDEHGHSAGDAAARSLLRSILQNFCERFLLALSGLRTRPALTARKKRLVGG